MLEISVSKITSLVVFPFLCLVSCTTVIDTRQEAGEVSWGFALRGKVSGIVYVKNSAGGTSGGTSRYGGVGGAIGGLRAAQERSLDPFSIEFSILGGALGEALTSDTEEYIRNTRCMYFVKLEDETLTENIKNSILYSNAVDEFVDDFFEDDVFGNISNSDKDRLAVEAQRSIQSKIGEQNIEVGGLITLSQSCDPSLKAGSEVIMSYSDTGGTIHPIEDVLKSIQ